MAKNIWSGLFWGLELLSDARGNFIFHTSMRMSHQIFHVNISVNISVNIGEFTKLDQVSLSKDFVDFQLESLWRS